jgi:hypothetical protein
MRRSKIIGGSFLSFFRRYTVKNLSTLILSVILLAIVYPLAVNAMTAKLTQVNPYAKVTLICYTADHLFVLAKEKNNQYEFPIKDIKGIIEDPKKWEWLKAGNDTHYILLKTSWQKSNSKNGFNWIMFDDSTFLTKGKRLIGPDKTQKFPHKTFKIETLNKKLMDQITTIVTEESETSTVE